ncbi:MAG: hypothetical protein HQL20_00125 [Candidatus Omnitrophica bacterium]|nr:hypothetical protein [Candidatus Omnitrophota bacterium]
MRPIKKYSLLTAAFFSLALILLWCVDHTAKDSTSAPLARIAHQRALTKKNAEITSLNFNMPGFTALQELLFSRRAVTAAEWQEYRSYYQNLVTAMPKIPEAYTFNGVCEYHSGNPAAAAENFQKAYYLNPALFWSKFNLGLTLYQTHDYERSYMLMSDAVKLDPLASVKYMLTSRTYQQIFSGRDTTTDTQAEKLFQNIQFAQKQALAIALACCFKLGQCPQEPPAGIPLDQIPPAVF